MMNSATLKLKATQELAMRLMTEHKLFGWQFRFNRAKRQMGVCRYPVRNRPGRIELSVHLVVRNEEAEIRDTILHEIAHALVGPQHGHDDVWKAKCIEIGAAPKRCGQAVMPIGKWQAACPGCQKSFHRHRKPVRRTGFFCAACGPERGTIVWRLAG